MNESMVSGTHKINTIISYVIINGSIESHYHEQLLTNQNHNHNIDTLTTGQCEVECMGFWYGRDHDYCSIILFRPRYSVASESIQGAFKSQIIASHSHV